jgi:hypothetical protein
MFAYNLRTRTMTGLGTLGGSSSTANDISGSTVVGQSRTAGNGFTGYAYDLRTGIRTDLGARLLTAQLISGAVVGGDGLLSSSFDLVTHTSAVIGPGRGVTEVRQITGNTMVGDNFAAAPTPPRHRSTAKASSQAARHFREERNRARTKARGDPRRNRGPRGAMLR